MVVDVIILSRHHHHRHHGLQQMYVLQHQMKLRESYHFMLQWGQYHFNSTLLPLLLQRKKKFLGIIQTPRCLDEDVPMAECAKALMTFAPVVVMDALWFLVVLLFPSGGGGEQTENHPTKRD
jgi:hypothetical protein